MDDFARKCLDTFGIPRAPLVVFASMLVALLSGTSNAINTIAQMVKLDQKIGNTETSVLTTCALIGLYFTFPVGYLNDKYGSGVTGFVCALLLAVFYVLGSFTGASTFYVLCACMLVVGFAGGGTFLAALTTAIKTSSSKMRGSAISVVGACMSFSLGITVLFYLTVANVANCHEPHCWPVLTRTLGFALACVMLPAFFILFLGEFGAKFHEYDEEDEEEGQLGASATDSLLANEARASRDGDDDNDGDGGNDDDDDDDFATPSYGQRSSSPPHTPAHLKAAPTYGSTDSEASTSSVVSEGGTRRKRKRRQQEEDAPPLVEGFSEDPMSVGESFIILKEKYFWYLTLAYFGGIGSGLYVVANTKQLTEPYLYTQIFDVHIWVALAFSVMNGTGTIVSGMLSDWLAHKYNVARTQVLAGNLGVMALLQLLLGAMHLHNSTSMTMDIFYLLCIVLLGFGFGSCFTMFPSVISTYYGHNNFGKFFGFLQIGSTLGTFIPVMFEPMTEVAGNWSGPFFIMALVCMVSTLLTFHPPFRTDEHGQKIIN